MIQLLDLHARAIILLNLAQVENITVTSALSLAKRKVVELVQRAVTMINALNAMILMRHHNCNKLKGQINLKWKIIAKAISKFKSWKRNFSNRKHLTSCCWEIRNCPSVLQAMYCFTIRTDMPDATIAILVFKVAINVINSAITMNARNATR